MFPGELPRTAMRDALLFLFFILLIEEKQIFFINIMGRNTKTMAQIRSLFLFDICFASKSEIDSNI